MRFYFFAIIPILAACGPQSDSESADERAITVVLQDPAIVSRDGFSQQEKKWPLTVEQGRLGCTDLARWVEVDGVRYGLNGLASEARGYREIDAIWQIDEAMASQLEELGAPNDPPIRISLADMMEEASRYCE